MLNKKVNDKKLLNHENTQNLSHNYKTLLEVFFSVTNLPSFRLPCPNNFFKFFFLFVFFSTSVR